MNTCENCGCNTHYGFCVNCDEEIFIADQYQELGEKVPDSILEKVEDILTK